MRPFFLFILLSLFTLAQAQDLIIGAVPFDPPFETLADNADHFIGFDIDLMLDICRRIEERCRFVPLSFDELFPNLAAGKLDLAISAIVITEARRANWLFSLPYLPSSSQLMTMANSSLASADDIRGKRVGIERGTIFKQLVMDMTSFSAKVVEFKSVDDVLQALSSSRVDAAMLDTASALYWIANNSQYKLLGSRISLGMGYGIMTRKENQGLIDRINQALTDMQNDGTYEKLYKSYFTPMTH